jgi:serine/threonine-protein kinase RsbW
MNKNLSIPSKIENLRLVEKLIDEISSEFKIHSDIYGNILISIVEAANNAMLHGNKLDEKKSVEMDFVVNDKKLVVTIKDHGPGFDFNNIPDPTSPENIEKINGRGVFLMQRLSDEIHFHENGSKVELIFNI